jgi:hypothetical protein
MNLPDNSSDSKSNLTRFVIAAVLIWAMEILRGLGRKLPFTVVEVLKLAGAGKSRTYETLRRLKEASEDLNQRPGRPVAAKSKPTNIEHVVRLTRDFLMENPGCVNRGVRRHSYGPSFRHFVLGLTASGGPAENLTVEQLADATGVPLGTLKKWLRMPNAPTKEHVPPKKAEPDIEQGQSPDEQYEEPVEETGGEQAEESSTPPSISISDPQIKTIVHEWPSWKGDFSAFCEHLKQNHRITVSRTFVCRLLDALGLRKNKKRGRNDPPWSKGAFKKIFPGAQWMSDGKTVAIRLQGVWYHFNWEATVDVDSNAVVGIDVREVENADALIASHEHGVATTGQSPIAETVDNKPSNLCPKVKQELDPTIVLEATPGRGQAKAPIEGTFGLFSQTAPPLVVEGKTPKALARSFLVLLLTLWAWARNGKPRNKLNGLPPADYYQNYEPTPEQIEKAKLWFTELMRRQEKFRQTLQRRADPIRRSILQQALTELDIADPDSRIASYLATYSMNAILHGIATFKSKKKMGTIPANADPGRYLGGIIRNLNEREELELTARHLLDLRLKHQELELTPLQQRASDIRQRYSIDKWPTLFVQQALDSKPLLDFRFWSDLAASSFANLNCHQATSTYNILSKKVASTFNVDRERRDDLIGRLSEAASLAHVSFQTSQSCNPR